MRIGLVGCGRLAELGYVPAVERCARVELCAVADPDPARRALVAAGTGVQGHPDLGSLLDAHEVDAVVLASPAEAHLADARLATEAGVPVLVEKPPAPDVERTARLVELGPSVHVGFNRRFDPGVRAVRDRVPTSGPVELDLGVQYRRASWDPHTVHDDVIDDLGPHLVDLARWLSGGEVLTVTARALTRDRAELELRLDRGWARVTCAADRHHAEHVVLADGDGSTIVEHRVGGLMAAVTGRMAAVANRVRGADAPHPLVVSLAAQLDAFARVVRSDRDDDLGTAADGLAVMVVLDAARTSATDAGRPVPLTDQNPERQPC